ncbi:hypothetical protein V502_01537 [Pseudogymnoascus sp. VKM F-4520 (FW-2644)]|nr:hypothetical protein V502_01537 [Pseudogymnoascus sp. VKM F-4520 (FW-2644)]
MVRNWESKGTNPFGYPAFTNVFAYPNGVAIIWNSAGDLNIPRNGSDDKDRSKRFVSAVLLFDYADRQECRFNYPTRNFIKGNENDFYLPEESFLTQENEAYSGFGDDSPLELSSELDDVSGQFHANSVEFKYDKPKYDNTGDDESGSEENASDSD